MENLREENDMISLREQESIYFQFVKATIL